MYKIKVWETEDDRDMGTPFEHECNIEDKEEAIDEAKSIYKLMSYAAVEVLTDDEEECIITLTDD